MDVEPSTDLTAERTDAAPRQRRRAWWTLCVAGAVLAHGAALAALVVPWTNPDDEAVDGAPAILVELTPVTTAPAPQPVEVAPGPQATAAQPQSDTAPAASPPDAPPPVLSTAAPGDPIPVAPEKNIEPPKPSPQPAVQAKPATRVKPETHRREAARATAPSAAERQAHASAPAPGADSRNDDALPNWRSQLLAQLERSKQYPAEARGDQGVAMLAFDVDRRGGVHRAHIARSSGSVALDRETLSLLQRAQPLPAPPPELGGAQIAVTVPISYSLR